jgi:hypothetical protein
MAYLRALRIYLEELEKIKKNITIIEAVEVYFKGSQNVDAGKVQNATKKSRSLK